MRGKSSPCHTRQAATRWFGPRVVFAALTAAPMRACAAAGSSFGSAGRITASIRPGDVSTTTDSRMPAIRSAFSMSSGYTLKPLGRTMMSLMRPDRISLPPSSKWPMSPLLYQPSSVNAAAVSSGSSQ